MYIMGKKPKNIKNSLILISIGTVFIIFGFNFLFTEENRIIDLCFVPACPEESEDKLVNLVIALIGIVFFVVGLDRLFKRAVILT